MQMYSEDEMKMGTTYPSIIWFDGKHATWSKCTNCPLGTLVVEARQIFQIGWCSDNKL